MIVTDSAAGTVMMTGTPSIHRFVAFGFTGCGGAGAGAFASGELGRWGEGR